MNPYLSELKFFSGNAYPPFVTKSNPGPIKDFIPVFIFHKVTEKEFEEKLLYLKQNNYKTISVMNLYALIKDRGMPLSPTVCLTFDDGHKSLFTTAYPLLRKYGFCATAFILPAFVGMDNFINWDEAIEMSGSEIIDIESHTFNHKRIFVSDRITAVNSPGFFRNELGLDRPSILLNGKETTNISFGAPVYEMDSRMSDKLRFLGDRFETLEEQSKDIKENLISSKKILEEKLNRPILHLAYPWGAGSLLSQKISKEVGFLTNFWGPVPEIPYNTTGSNPYKLVRLKDDYIFRLPGTGRKSLLSIFSLKAKRRKTAKEKGGDIY